MAPTQPLPWLEPGEPFPPVSQAWGVNSDAPGLLAAGGELTERTLRSAYGQGIFPWFSPGQPVLWWSTDPRMVLKVQNFKLHRSLRKSIKNFHRNSSCEIRMDSDFARVIEACAGTPRFGQKGTWIVPQMVAAYKKLHQAGYAHSVETWVNGEMVGGLYCVALGQAVFGESMFAHVKDASKIALAALVGFSRSHDIQMIDCQQNTQHLASLGAAEISRDSFLQHIQQAQSLPAPAWRFKPLYWQAILDR